MTDIFAILKEYWGFETFRPGQEEVIRSLLEGHDTLALLPTGGGKSLTFQIPALALGGLCLVITPLIALMKDQTDHLTQRGIKAAYLHAGQTRQEQVEIYDRVGEEHYNFLYLSPERLRSPLFQARLQYLDVRLVVVDEAHCISAWGYDFRPAYRLIGELRTLLRRPDVPFIALTATATEAVVADVVRQLRFRPDFRVIRGSFVRHNLTYTVLYTDDQVTRTADLLREVSCGIVYVRNRELTVELATQLKRLGIQTEFYHAGLSSSDRQRRQERWMRGEVAVMVATNAFGMGIDKADVRRVIHWGPPPSPEEYIQEAGRAGRDGAPAEAILIVYGSSETNYNHLRTLVAQQFPERDYIKYVYERLGSFFQVAVGAGEFAVFDFQIDRFCAAYKLSQEVTYRSLKLLEQAGYLLYREQPDSLSSVRMTVPREQLYRLKADRKSSEILHYLLRLYAGIFADWVPIREETIAERIEREGIERVTTLEVVHTLQQLQRQQILYYRPRRTLPSLVFLTPRLDRGDLRIGHEIYEDSRDRLMRRAQAMGQYIANREQCRQRQLLRYFDEEPTEDCGLCDVCRQKNAHF
jgi:ATP-dependent DNA helicase RecQ